MAVYEIYSFPAGYGTINAELERKWLRLHLVEPFLAFSGRCSIEV
jgi:hypothetical protein